MNSSTGAILDGKPARTSSRESRAAVRCVNARAAGGCQNRYSRAALTNVTSDRLTSVHFGSAVSVRFRGFLDSFIIVFLLLHSHRDRYVKGVMYADEQQ